MDVEIFNWLTGAIGIMVGLIAGLNGFAQPVGDNALKQGPRIKNLGWVLTGFLGLYIADAKRLGLPADFSMLAPTVWYGFGALGGILTAVALMYGSIKRSVDQFNAQHRFKLDLNLLVREYLTHGKERYDELHEKEKSRLLAEEARYTVAAARRALQDEADLKIVECLYGVLAYLAAPPSAPRPGSKELIETIIKAACLFIRAHANTNLTVDGSYMAYIPANQASDAIKNAALFRTDMPDGYQGYLELRLGGGKALRDVIIPVAAGASRVLPGAPQAVASFDVAMMDIHGGFEFASDVSQAVQREIQQFFDAPYFKNIASVTSLVVLKGDKICGVLNIESSAPRLLGEDAATAQSVLTRLQTPIALLSTFE